MKNNEVHFNLDESTLRLLKYIDENYFNYNLDKKELIKYCIKIAYIYHVKLEELEDR